MLLVRLNFVSRMGSLHAITFFQETYSGVQLAISATPLESAVIREPFTCSPPLSFCAIVYQLNPGVSFFMELRRGI